MILQLIEVDIIMIYSAIYSELHVTILFESSLNQVKCSYINDEKNVVASLKDIVYNTSEHY